MAAWQRLSAGAACAGLAAPCPQFPRLSTSRSVGLYNLCSGMCRGSGLFPCEESRVLPRTRHRSPRLSQQLRSSLHSSLPPPSLSSPGQALYVENKRQTVRTKTEHVPMEGEKKTKQTNNNKNTKRFLQCHAGVCSAAEPCSGDSEPGPPLGPTRPWSQR